MLTYVLFAIGFAFLVKGADFLVEGSTSLARRLGISSLIVALTVVAFGTSTPELVVNLFASAQGNAPLAIGNVLGSNIANILLILGVVALMRDVAVTRELVWKQIPLSLVAAVVLGVLVNDVGIHGAGRDQLSRIDGLILLGCFAAFVYYLLLLAKGQRAAARPEIATEGLGRSLLLVVAGLTGLVLGGKWIVDGAIHIADTLGMSERFIGLTIVAMGTSLPEMATSVTAARRGSVDIAVGNAVGSNIFNIFLVLGLSAVVRPLPFGSGSNVDIGVTVMASGLLFLAMFTGVSRHRLERWEGAVFLMAYAGYISYLVASR